MPTEDEMFLAASRLALRGHLTTYAGYVPPDVERMLHEVAACLAIAEPGMVEVMAKARREKGKRGTGK